MSGSSLPGRTHSTHCAEKTNGGASTPHPRTRRNSIPAAQECTPPASLCRGFRHTRATIGDVGKPRAIRQNTLVGVVPGVAAWVDEFVPTEHVVGQSGGALDPPARRLTGSLHVRVWEVLEWAGVGRSAGGGVGGVGGVPILPPVGPRCAWRGVAVGGSVCQFRVCSCLLGHCTRSVGNAPLLFGCTAPYRVQRPHACGGCELRPETWTRLMVAVMRLLVGPDPGILRGSSVLELSSAWVVFRAWGVFCLGLCGASCCGS